MRNLLTIALLTASTNALAQSSLECPSTSSPTSFAAGTMQTECSSSVTQSCTSKAGVTWDTAASLLKLPGSAGNFQAPPGAAVPQNVYFAASADFDRDGWDDFVAATDTDQIYVMRNQTITCGKTSCSGSSSVAPTVQTISDTDTWWNTLTNKRPSAFRAITNTSGTHLPLKATAGSGFRLTPMVAADFNGDGWPDVAAISVNINGTYGSAAAWPTAARLYLNTKNCRSSTNVPCGIGMLCSGQPSNGACSGSGISSSGSAFSESNLSCTNTNTCNKYMPTFATYDLRAPSNQGNGTATAVAVSGSGVNGIVNTSNAVSSSNPATYKPGDFGPLERPATNMQALDWDGDGDIDILYGHGPGTCPGSLCTTSSQVFYAGIDVWKNDCAQSSQWNSTTKSCGTHIPTFSRSLTACTGTTCANADTLIPSTAHNTTTIAPNTNLGFDYALHRSPVFQFADIDKDNDLDLVLGSVGCCNGTGNEGRRLRIYRNTSNSASVHTLDTANPLVLSTSSGTYPGFEGSMTAVFVHDFSGDGWPDIITGSDAFAYSGSIGGRSRYWRHTGNTLNPYGTNWPSCSSNPAACTNCSATCNPSPTQKLSESCGSSGCAAQPSASPAPKFGDFDWGLMIDYDHDPQRTRDMIFTNGNTTSDFYIFPNRASADTVAACGSVASGTLPTPSSELTVNGACITPSASVPSNTEIRYYLNNESPSNYQLACTQRSTGFTPALNSSNQCCVTFPNITGRTITWEARFDSNLSDGNGVCSSIGSDSPTLTSISATYTYTQPSQHYQAGVIQSDGVVYVGSFTQPGNRGHMHALAAGDGTSYFDGGTKLDSQATRYVYTTDNLGTSPTRIAFSPTSPSTTLQARVGASTASQATTVINWVLSARFGIGNGEAATKLGAVMHSTPAILNKPYRPNWYAFLSSTDKALYDGFAVANASRVPLVLFAAMDGMLHALITLPTNITSSRNGEEAWAFVPPYVATNMTSDYTASVAAGEAVVTSYPDGSPALIDYRRSDNTIATAAVFSDGYGGSSITALDVTNTIDPSFVRTGPTPLWSHQPGGADAGKAISKPGIARVKIGGTEKFVVIAGSGVHGTDTTKGRVVSGLDLETGTLLWKFELECALTSDIIVFDTDDIGEANAPLVDGIADRAVFADNCGYVYKIDPAQNLSGGYMSNTNMGSISVGTKNGAVRYALFSTQSTSGAIGEQRPIVGTMGARTDSTTDIVLFFGTGGLDSYDPTKVNEFYAVYARNGVIRNKVTGTCVSNRCEKFYGGVVVTPDSVIVQRSIDPEIGGTCSFGTSSVQAYSLNAPYGQVFDLDEIDGNPIAASRGPLYGDGGALYFATISGEIKRVGAPRAATAGADSAAGLGQGNGTPETTTSSGMVLLGWRNVL
jgi:hypothetical protein